MSNESDLQKGFLSRWSQRKSEHKNSVEPIAESSDDSNLERSEQAQQSDQDLNEADTDLPIWQQADADPQEKTAALRALFKQPEFNEIDRLNDYDQDFSQYNSIKGLVTTQMKRMIKLAEQKTRPEQAQDTIKSHVEGASDTEQALAIPASESPDTEVNNEPQEDKPLA